MSLLNEIEEKLNQAEEQLSSLLQQVQEGQSLLDSLSAASKGLSEASESVSKAADSTNSGGKHLATAVTALREAIAVLSQLEPEVVISKIDGLTEKVELSGESLRTEVRTSISRFSDEQRAVNRRASLWTYANSAVLVAILLLTLFATIA